MSGEQFRIEITSEDPPRQVTVTAPIEVGREGKDLQLGDPTASRRHFSLDGTSGALVIEDLGSANGTFVNGQVIDGSRTLQQGDEIRAGNTTLTVLAPERVATHTTSAPAAVVADAVEPAGVPVAQPSPLQAGLESIVNEAVEIRFRPGTAGETSAKPMAAAASRARAKLRGIGSEATAGRPVFYLVDPFPDPADPSRTITSGSLVDAERNEIWMAASAEAPPEDPHRVLAILFGAGLTSADDAQFLLEGYGLHLADAPSTRPELENVALPPLYDADGELRGAMAVDFVRFLLEREGEPSLRALFAAPAGQLEQTYLDQYGTTSAALELAWQREVAAGEPDVKTGEFLRVSLHHLRPYWKRQGEIFILMLLSLAFTAAFPFVTRRLFDTALPSGEFSQVLTLLLILGAAFAISLVAGLRQAYQSAWVGGSVVKDIRQNMFDRLQTLPEGWYSRHQQGDVLSRLFSDVGAVQATLTDTISQGIFQMLTLVISAAIMMTLDWKLGIIVLVGAPLVGFVYKAMGKGAQERSIAMQEENSSLLNTAAENYAAIPVVRMFGLRRREGQRFNRASGRLFKAEVRMSLWGGFFGLSVNMIVTALRLIVIGLGAWLILDGQFTIGGLVAFLGIMGEVISPVTVLTTIGQDIQAAMGSLHRINEVMEAETEPIEDEGKVVLAPLASEIRLRNMSFSYTTERRALDSIDAVIEAGTRVAFVGPSGSGKSTVLRMLMRMYEPEEGSIELDGVDIRDGTIDSLRGQMGAVFQDPFLFDTTIRENIAFGNADATDAQITAAAEAAEIDQFVNSLPRGYDTLVGERGGSLSGGQRQRVSIARALVRDPRILLLDEATSALDPKTEGQINETLARVGGDRTVVSITHRLTSIVDYDRILVIEEGSLVEQGTHDELVELGGTYAHLWAEQTGAPVPERAPFDAAAALAGVAFFSGLEREELDAIASSMRAFTLDAGETLAEGRGRLVVVARGRGEILSPSVGGELVHTAEVGSGAAFGVHALLGEETGTVLRSIETLELLELDSVALEAAGARYPEVAAALGGQREILVAPVSGVRLDRATFAGRASQLMAAATGPRATAAGPDEIAIRKATGAFPRVDV